MPLYSFDCPDHGTFQLVQGMSEEHTGKCHKCQRVFSSPAIKLHGQFPKMGNTRQELFDNMAKEGMADKDWRRYDSYYHKAKGINNVKSLEVSV